MISGKIARCNIHGCLVFLGSDQSHNEHGKCSLTLPDDNNHFFEEDEFMDLLKRTTVSGVKTWE